MDNEHFIRKHYLLQHGCFFSTFYNCESSLFTYSDLIHCFIWNHSIPLCLPKEQREEYVENVVRFFSSRDRRACIYLDSNATDDDFISLLSKKGFECIDNEAWMLWNNDREIILTDKLSMQIVQDECIEGFLEVCSSCFEPEYSEAIRRDFNRLYCNKAFVHFVFYLDKQIVGIGSCYFDQDIAIIHNIGVAKPYRRRGYGSEIVNAIVLYAKEKLHLSEILLQCDGGGYIEEMYKKIGFRNIYRRLGYVRQDATCMP